MRLLIKKNAIFQKNLKDRRTTDNYNHVQSCMAELTDAKYKCFKCLGDKFHNPTTSSNRKKAPIIHFLLINDELARAFPEKANNFNNFFNKQCQCIYNYTTLPVNFIFETTNC